MTARPQDLAGRHAPSGHASEAQRAASLADFLNQAYRPAQDLGELLQLLVKGLLAQVDAAEVRILLRDEVVAAAADTWTAASDQRAARRYDWPLIHGGERLGELGVTWANTAQALSAADLALCEDLASRCAYLARRYHVRAWALERLGCGPLLVGTSAQLHQLEVFVEKAAPSLLPVLIKGEFGTEKAPFALALHCCGPVATQPFIEVNCAEPSGQPAQWFEQAHGGTLFFNGIDELSPAWQSQLPQHMPSRLGQWLAVPRHGQVRVIASSTADLAERVREGRFSRALLAELDFLAVTVPPLRDRPADMKALITATLTRHGHDAGRVCSDALIDVCRRHAWPENLFELERVVARLAVMTGGQPIGEADVRRHAPWLMHPGERPDVFSTGASTGDEPMGTSAPTSTCVAAPAPRIDASPLHWARCVAERDAVELGRLHDGLRKALLYLAEHYADTLSLADLARQAHVSPSHLGYLFRSGLGTTFKPLLQHVRVEKAKDILGAETRARITEVALRVGFGDLSHFERSFRRIAGQSPRAFQRSAASNAACYR